MQHEKEGDKRRISLARLSFVQCPRNLVYDPFRKALHFNGAPFDRFFFFDAYFFFLCC